MIGAVPKVKLAKEPGRSKLIGPSEEAVLLKVAKQPLRDALILIDDSGMRPHEIFRMRKDLIDWQGLVYRNPNGKSEEARRYIALTDRMLEILKRRMEGDSPWIFPSKRSASGHLTTLAKQFQAAREAANLPDDLVFYCGKHGFCTDVMRRTGNVFALMKAVGPQGRETYHAVPASRNRTGKGSGEPKKLRTRKQPRSAIQELRNSGKCFRLW
jgi:integrase